MSLLAYAERSVRATQSLGSAANFGPPPADADQEESPVVEEFGRLAFKGVADELEDPSDDEERQGDEPEAMKEEAGDEDGYGDDDEGDAERVAEPIDGMLVAARVLRDPLLAGASA
jgi:hypothetical protein